MAHSTTEEEKGRAGGWFQAGNLGGGGLGGGAGLWIAGHLPGAWLPGAVLAAVCLLCGLALPFVQEPEAAHRSGGAWRSMAAVVKDLWHVARSRRGYLGLLICFLPIGSGAASNLWASIAGDWHATADTVAMINGALSGLVAAAGCIVGGYACDRMDRKAAYGLYGVLMALCAAAMAFAPRTPGMYVGFVMAYAFITGLTYAGFSAVVLEAIGHGAAATKYSLFASLSNMPIAYMTVAEGWAHTRGGGSAMLYCEAAIGLAGLLVFVGLAALSKRAATTPAPLLRTARTLLFGVVILQAAGARAAQFAGPEWIIQGSGAFSDRGRRIFVGVGIVQGIKDRSFAAAAANLRACAEAGKALNDSASALMKEHDAASEQKTPSTISSRYDRTLRGTVITDRWRDPSDGAEYSRCELDLEGRESQLSAAMSKPEIQAAFDKTATKAAGLGPLAGWTGHGEAVRSVALSADGARALSADSRTIALWETATGRLLWARAAAAALVAFSADGKTVAAAGLDGLVHSWDAATGAPRPSPDNELQMKALIKSVMDHPKTGEQTVTSTSIDKVKGSLAGSGVEISAECTGKDFMSSATNADMTSSREDMKVILSGSASLMQPPPKVLRRLRWTDEITVEGDMTAGVERVSLIDESSSADGRRWLAAGADGALSFTDPTRREPPRSAKIEGLRAAALSADGAAALTGSAAPTDNLALWDAAEGKKMGSWTLPAPVTAIAFAPDGKTALLGLGSDRDNLWVLALPPAKQGRPVYDKSARIVSLSAPEP